MLIDLQAKHALTNLNTMRLKSTAKYFYTLTSIDELDVLANYIYTQKLPFFVLGGGSNILLPEQYAGLVIFNQLRGIYLLEDTPNYATIRAYAGEVWDEFVAYTVEHGFFGLENLSLIPGTVGAAPIQNIGAYGVEVKDFIDHVEIYDLTSKTIKSLSNADCCFSYRNSLFKTQPNYIVISVTFKLTKTPHLNISYADLAARLSKIPNLTAQQVRDGVIAIRKSKLPDPKVIANVGSFFHNPILPIAQINKLLELLPALPVYPVNDIVSKISAGYLIDSLGLKGYRHGKVGVYEKQALVLVNYEDATQNEILDFANLIIERVFQAYGVELSIEPIIIR